MIESLDNIISDNKNPSKKIIENKEIKQLESLKIDLIYFWGELN